MEALSRNLVPYMFARVSLGKATAEDSVAMTAWELKRIWRKWRSGRRGLRAPPPSEEPTPGLEPGTPSLRVKCSTS